MTLQPGWWVAILLTSLVLGAAMCWFLVRWRRAQRTLQTALHALRQEHLGLTGLLDAWCWRTDAHHRLIRLVPPGSTEMLAWSDLRTGGWLWERFQGTDEAVLRARLDAHGALNERGVHQVQEGKILATGVLRAAPLSDLNGQFNGHIGTFQVHADTVHLAVPDSHDEQASFSYTVSHDLRAPIRVVEGFAKILKEDYGRVLDRVGNDHLDRILGAALRMNRMIDSLLTLAQLSCVPLLNEPVNLSQLATYVVDDLRRQSPERRVEVHIEPGLMAVGDPTLLRMALENLLGNAWKYSGKTPHACIRFERHPQDPRSFTVRDNGAGFDMRFADRLFEVFQRLHGANDFQGTGVGLASVRRIIRRHGGDIWADGEVNQGARFHFSLNACEPVTPADSSLV
ncbi:MAG: ATP-binding protein [Pseudomonadota bacterium]